MNNERGIALLIVLTVVTLLTIAVIEFTYAVQLDQHRARNSINQLQAQLLARSGINIVESFLAQDQDPIFDAFTEEWWMNLGVFCEGLELSPSVRLRCDVEDESGKINLNLTRTLRQSAAAAQQGQQARTKDMFLRDALRQLFEAYEIDVQIPDRLEEYWSQETEPDAQGRIPGVEPLHSIEEFAAKFAVPTEKLPRLRRVLTAQPTSILGWININSAPAEVLYAVLAADGKDSEVVSEVMDRQRDEERVFRSKGAISEVLGDMEADKRAAMSQIFDVRSSLYRLQASALTNVDPTGLTPGGIGQTLSVLVQRRSGRQSTGRSNTNQPNASGGEQEITWTFRLLDWQREGGARLFRAGLDNQLNPSEDEQKRDTSLQ